MEQYLVCQKTGKQYAATEKMWQSPDGGIFDLSFNARFHPDVIQLRPASMWRYREALPIVHNKNIVSFGEGYTPLVEEEIHGRKVHLKLEHLFPSGSYKDRGASVLISKVKELGIEKVVEDSSGNAGSAIAAYCARAGIACDIYVPESTSKGKLVQIEKYGANLHLVPGTREDTARAVLEAAQDTYYASHSWNPYFFHGTKTFAFEVVEQLGWKAPDALVVPVGNGTLLYGAFLGFKEMKEAGVIDRYPKIYGVQAANCAPLYKGWRTGIDTYIPIDKQQTVAEGIAIAEPLRGAQILEALDVTSGAMRSVREDEILKSLALLHSKGFFVEPTSAAVIAALKSISVEGTIIVPLTGHGLKATEKIAKL